MTMIEPMTRDERTLFILELTADVTTAIIERVEDMPDGWDGGELRRYIADKFTEQVDEPFVITPVWGHGRSKRLRAYHQDLITRNL